MSNHNSSGQILHFLDRIIFLSQSLCEDELCLTYCRRTLSWKCSKVANTTKHTRVNQAVPTPTSGGPFKKASFPYRRAPLHHGLDRMRIYMGLSWMRRIWRDWMRWIEGRRGRSVGTLLMLSKSGIGAQYLRRRRSELEAGFHVEERWRQLKQMLITP